MADRPSDEERSFGWKAKAGCVAFLMTGYTAKALMMDSTWGERAGGLAIVFAVIAAVLFSERWWDDRK